MGRTTRFALLPFLALAACGGQALSMPAAAAPESAPPSSSPVATAASFPGLPTATSQGAVPAGAPPAGTSQPAASLRAPLVTYTGELSLRVDRDVPATLERTIAIAEASGGYLSARHDASVEVRVPSPRFRESMAKIEVLGDVTHRGVSASDVSDEFHDAEVRLQNLRATRARLEALLGRAGSLADTLAVERELERIALEIDRLEGRLEYLKAKVAYSSLTVAVEAARAAPPRASTLAPKRFVALPVRWLGELGADRLLTIH